MLLIGISGRIIVGPDFCSKVQISKSNLSKVFIWYWLLGSLPRLHFFIMSDATCSWKSRSGHFVSCVYLYLIDH